MSREGGRDQPTGARSPASTKLVPDEQPTVAYGPPLTVERLIWYPDAPTGAVHDSETCPLAGVALGLVGGARATIRVVDVVWDRDPLVPVMVRDRA